MADPRNPYDPDSDLYRKLTKLLSGPIAKYKQQSPAQLRRIELNKYKFTSASGHAFRKEFYGDIVESLRIHTLLNQSRIQRYTDFDAMEFCLHGDTRIAVPGGYKTLKELSEEYGLEKEFIVYSYDHEKKEIVPAIGRQARKTRTDEAWKVTFENGQEIIGTANHRLMLSDGSYCRIDELNPGDFLMSSVTNPVVDGLLVREEHDAWKKENQGFEIEKNLFDGFIELCDSFGYNEGLYRDIENYHDVQNCLKLNGFDSFESFALAYDPTRVERENKVESDHKVKSVEYFGVIDLYDLTVDRYKNFATDSVISHNTPEINTALNIVSEEITYSNSLQPLLRIDCPNVEIKEILKTLFYDVLNLESNLFPWVRSTVKMGDMFLYLDVDQKLGVKGAISLPVREVERLEGQDKTNPNYVQYQWNSGGLTFENWQIAHFRNLGNDKYYPFGVSMLDGARRLWRMYQMILDAVLNYRIVRCLHGDTEILVGSNGETKKIKDIKVGDKVSSYNGECCVLTTVTDWVNNGEQQIWEVKTSDKLIKANFNHPVLVRNKETEVIDYVEVQNLVVDKHQLVDLLDSQRYKDIISVETTSEYSDVYDIRVDNECHNFVLANGCVVHNSPERRVFYIDVGNIDPSDVEQYVQKVISSYKRHTMVDENTGHAELRHRVMASENDFFIAVRGNQSATKIETLPGGAYTGDVDDVKLFRDMMMSAIGIPTSYVIQLDNKEDKSTLAQKDIRFARSIQRYQRTFTAELTKIAIIHLFTLGFRGDDLLKFKINLNNPSKLAEMQELDYWKMKLDVAAGAKDFFSTRWISTNIFGQTEEEWYRIQRERHYDAKMDAAMDAAEEIGSGTFGSDKGGAVGEDESLDQALDSLPDTGVPEIEAPAGSSETPEGEESVLLTAPAKRESEPAPGEPHLTPFAKGKEYTPVVVDDRPDGARIRHNMGTYSKELARGTDRNLWKGQDTFRSLSHNIAESKEPGDQAIEKEITATNYDVRILMESLEKKSQQEQKKNAEQTDSEVRS